ncbi:MAG: hypothetical protein P4L84_37725 [Isosphaeraceae bacterium]|nr:hypothetical protein [Isosphaeraceae bacterium]
MRRLTIRPAALLTLLLGLSPGAAPPDDEPTPERPTLEMSPAVACRSVAGFEDYEPLPDAALTSEDKLIIYYRPSGFQSAREGRTYRAHLTQDGQIRRRDSKLVLYHKEKLLEFEPKGDRPIENIYIKCIVSLKTLKPGDYSFDIILHDEIGKGPPAKQVLKFKVIPIATTAPKEAPDEP